MEKYFRLLDQYCQYDYSCFAKEHLSRAHTFRYAYEYLSGLEHPVITELGTTRSFVHGGHEGCMVFDEKYWFPDKPELWDWSAGCFTRVFAEIGKGELHTIDLIKNHVWVAEIMTKEFNHVKYYHQDSCAFLNWFPGDFDLVYLDTGDMNPIETTGRLHEREASIIIERGLVRIGGLVLMDDVRNPVPIREFGEKSRFGKDKYSIGKFLSNGFDIVMDEYQMLLKRMA